MTPNLYLDLALLVVVLAAILFALHRIFPGMTVKSVEAAAKGEIPKIVDAFALVRANLEAFEHAELVKLAGAIMDHLADTSAAEKQIKDGQAAMASQAQLLVAVQARVAAARISAASQ